MLDNDRIDVSKKNNDSHERIVLSSLLLFSFFLIKYQACIFDDCHDLLLHKVVTFDDAAIFIAAQIIAKFICGI